jgi:solute carrier family 13 (sodium-dependent dicarboxylate transporter), member 2/3/5
VPPVPHAEPKVRPVAALACLAVAALAWMLPLGLEPKAHAALAIVVAVGGLWVTEALPLGATALLVPVLGIATGAASAKEAFSGFGNPVVFLFLGTFLLTDAASQHGLDRRLADRVMTSDWVRARPRRLLFAIAFLGCAISAWMNNTATTAMLLPLAMVSARLGSRPFLVSVLLMTAYAPTLGGLATPVGTAPNLIGLGKIDDFAKATGLVLERPSFARWMLCFAPLAVVATVGTAAWLAWRGGRTAMPTMPDPTHEFRKWTRDERVLLWVFGAVILLWVAPGTVSGLLSPEAKAQAAWLGTWSERLPEPCVPLLGGVLLFLLPSVREGGGRLADASVFRRLDWSTILLFGGGISLGSMMESTGLAKALGEALFHGIPWKGEFGITLAATLMAVIVSEFASNTASAALVVPVVLRLAHTAGMDPVGPALAATIGCSFGFMLPVSTPPNALVYGTGKLRIAEMVRCGLVLDVAGALLVAAWVTLVL